MDWNIVVASNSKEVLSSTLLISPDVRTHNNVIIQEGFPSASKAYNDGISKTLAEIIVFPHQDVFLPPGWIDRLRESVAWLDAHDPAWAVAGVFGLDPAGAPAGHVYSTGLRRSLGSEFDHPVPVRSLDEMVLILRRGSGLSFDESLPGFHLYGTDICLEAEREGYRSYALPCFCVHNSNGIRFLPRSYWKSYLYMRRKWQRQLPIQTPCMQITRWGWPALRYLARIPLALARRRINPGVRVPDPARLFSDLAGAVEAQVEGAPEQSGKTDNSIDATSVRGHRPA